MATLGNTNTYLTTYSYPNQLNDPYFIGSKQTTPAYKISISSIYGRIFVAGIIQVALGVWDSDGALIDYVIIETATSIEDWYGDDFASPLLIDASSTIYIGMVNLEEVATLVVDADTPGTAREYRMLIDDTIGNVGDFTSVPIDTDNYYPSIYVNYTKYETLTNVGKIHNVSLGDISEINGYDKYDLDYISTIP